MILRNRQIKLTNDEVQLITVSLYYYSYEIKNAMKAIDGNLPSEDETTVYKVLQKEDDRIDHVLHKLHKLH